MSELSNNTWMGSVMKEMKNTPLLVPIVVILSILITSHPIPVWAAWTEGATVNKAVSLAAEVQGSPRSVSDGSGGAIITWEDRRNGSYDDIYAQRVDANGNVLWTADDLPIAVVAGSSQSEPAIVSDGSGGAIITWQDGRSGDTDIYTQRVDSNGNVLWTANGVQTSIAAGDNRNPSIVSDGSGGAIITWYSSLKDPNSPTVSIYTYSIYAQKVDADGNVLWTPHDARISIGQPDNRYKIGPEIVSDGSGGAIITWYDNREGNYTPDIYAQRVLAAGNTYWTIGGVPVSIANESQINPKIVSDGSGGAIIAWEDFRSGNHYDIYAQKVDDEGNRLWEVDGQPISTAASNHDNPRIVSDGSGGAIITWNGDYGAEYYDIYAQRVDTAGNLLWGVDGKPISTEVEDQNYPQIASDGSGGAIITWQDGRNYYDPDGEEETGISIMAVGDTGYDIYAQRVDADGNMLWTVDGQPISTAVDDQNDPTIVSDGSGGAIITWQDRRNGGNYGDIYAQRVYSNGTLIDSDGDGVSDSEDDNPGDATIATPQTTTGTGKITVDTGGLFSLANVKTLSDSDPGLNQTGKPSGYEFPDGLVSFQVTGVTAGGTITVTLTFPTTFPPGSEYYKSDADGFYLFSGAVISGNTVTLTLTDDGSRSGGDSNGTADDGVIDDPGGVAVPAGVPTYNEYDKDENCQIEDFELLDAIDAWAGGLLLDFDLLDLIDYWANGSYC